MSPPIIEIAGVSKQYGALRPLRIERLHVAAGEQVAILGVDQPAAEVFINLLTGASLPDAGTVTVLGQSTAAIGDSEEWLSTLDRFGIVSERAALLDSLSVVQNLAVPFSLDIEPPTDAVRAQAVALAREGGLDEASWDRPAGGLDATSRLRLRYARALAFNPAILLLEHPSASVPRGEAVKLAQDLRRVAEGRGAAAITLTMDRDVAREIARTVLSLEGATGRLKEEGLGKIGFWRR